VVVPEVLVVEVNVLDVVILVDVSVVPVCVDVVKMQEPHMTGHNAFVSLPRAFFCEQKRTSKFEEQISASGSPLHTGVVDVIVKVVAVVVVPVVFTHELHKTGHSLCTTLFGKQIFST
jgi:hypothetical protein